MWNTLESKILPRIEKLHPAALLSGPLPQPITVLRSSERETSKKVTLRGFHNTASINSAKACLYSNLARPKMSGLTVFHAQRTMTTFQQLVDDGLNMLTGYGPVACYLRYGLGLTLAEELQHRLLTGRDAALFVKHLSSRS